MVVLYTTKEDLVFTTSIIPFSPGEYQCIEISETQFDGAQVAKIKALKVIPANLVPTPRTDFRNCGIRDTVCTSATGF